MKRKFIKGFWIDWAKKPELYRLISLLFIFLWASHVQAEEHPKKGGEEGSSTESSYKGPPVPDMFRENALPIGVARIDTVGNRVSHLVLIPYTVEFTEKKYQDKYKFWKHRIHDLALKSIYHYLQVWWDGKSPLSNSDVTKLLQKIHEKYLGKDSVKLLILQGFQIEKSR